MKQGVQVMPGPHHNIECSGFGALEGNKNLSFWSVDGVTLSDETSIKSLEGENFQQGQLGINMAQV